MICRPSDHTLGRPRAGIRTQDGRSIEAETLTTRPPHVLIRPLHLLTIDHHTSLINTWCMRRMCIKTNPTPPPPRDVENTSMMDFVFCSKYFCRFFSSEIVQNEKCFTEMYGFYPLFYLAGGTRRHPHQFCLQQNRSVHHVMYSLYHWENSEFLDRN